MSTETKPQQASQGIGHSPEAVFHRRVSTAVFGLLARFRENPERHWFDFYGQPRLTEAVRKHFDDNGWVTEMAHEVGYQTAGGIDVPAVPRLRITLPEEWQ